MAQRDESWFESDVLSTQSLHTGTPGAMASPASGRRWFVAHVFTGRERAAETHLKNQGFKTFYPVEIRTVRHARRQLTRERAFLPGYLFVEFDPSSDRWRAINGTHGVKRLIMQFERPVPCPRGLVENLLASADEKGVIDTSDRLKPGQKVKVRAGPFAEVVGTLERLDNAGRARVLLEIMSGERAVRIGIHDIEAV